MKAEQMADEPLRIVCVGDSITGRSDLGKFVKFSHIVEVMARAYRGNGAVVTYNAGVAGNTTAMVLDRLEEDVLALRPTIVVLLAGGNDASPDKPVRRDIVRQNLDDIARRIIETGAKLLILRYHVLPNPAHPESAWLHLASNNDLIADVAAARNIPVLDMASPMSRAAEAQPLGELVNDVDGVHLAPGGELVFAEAIFNKLVELAWL